MITGSQLCVSRGRRMILEEIDIAVRPGEILTIVGPNGAGKSTLLRTLSGELSPTHGEVRIDDQPVASMTPAELAKRRALLAQQTICTLPFRVVELVAFAADCSEDEVWFAMEAAGVIHLAERRIDALSGGEQQRVHWARTLAQLGTAGEGKYLLLDEPVSSLDLAHQHELLSHARELAGKGVGVVSILHDLNLTAQYADRIAVLHEAKIVADGPPEAVLTVRQLRDVFGVHARISAPPETPSLHLFVEGMAGPRRDKPGISQGVDAQPPR